MTQRHGDWIQTYSGRQFHPLDPSADEIDIVDIAHALSNVCRFNGHCARHYSVAEHSVLVMAITEALLAKMIGSPSVMRITHGGFGPPVRTPQGEALAFALLHDASEAYLADIAAPLKRLPEFEGYLKIEAHVQRTIEQALIGPGKLTDEEAGLVRKADLVALSYEKDRLMLPPPKSWGDLPDWHEFEFLRQWRIGLSPREAAQAFATAATDLRIR